MKEFIAHLAQKRIGKLDQEKALSKSTIRLILAKLSFIINHAKDAGLVGDNPASRLSRLYRESPSRDEEICPPTAEEVAKFPAAALKHVSRYYPLFLCATQTGLRPGELAELKWGDVDFHGKFIVVWRTISGAHVREKTKTGKKRRVNVSDELLESLVGLRRKRKADFLAKGDNQIPEWVFINREGNPLDMDNIRDRVFFKALDKAGLRRMRLHDLRHTFASLHIQKGESLAYVRDQLGHGSIKTTVDIYGHLVPGANREAANRLPGLRVKNGGGLEAKLDGEEKAKSASNLQVSAILP